MSDNSDVEMQVEQELHKSMYGNDLTRFFALPEPCWNLSKYPYKYKQRLAITGFINRTNERYIIESITNIIHKYIYSKNIFVYYPFGIKCYRGHQLIKINKTGKQAIKISDGDKYKLTPVQIYGLIDNSIVMYKYSFYFWNTIFFGFSIYNCQNPNLPIIEHFEDNAQRDCDPNYTVNVTVNTRSNVDNNPQIRIDYEPISGIPAIKKPLGTLYKNVPFDNGEQYYMCVLLFDENQKCTLEKFEYQTKVWYN